MNRRVAFVLRVSFSRAARRRPLRGVRPARAWTRRGWHWRRPGAHGVDRQLGSALAAQLPEPAPDLMSSTVALRTDEEPLAVRADRVERPFTGRAG
ncbi:hypothetical protein [Pseudonocardia hierapolitana]|uniref:hypothetical protein n=1 Tax=Pseudonocardia hierapolitana TaxID=1128676 RepID=UPI0011BDEF3F|nr:hypothetical protein [Pseudonocardia hierapolitana]